MITTIGTRPDGSKFRADPRRMHTYHNCTMETREPTAEEIEQLGIPTTIVAIDIPVAAFQKAPTLLAKLDLLIKFYDGIERFTNGNTTHLRNIDIKDVEKYVSVEEYQEWKNAGVIFPPEVEALYASKGK